MTNPFDPTPIAMYSSPPPAVPDGPSTKGMPDFGQLWPPRPFDIAQRAFQVYDAWYSSNVPALEMIYIQQNRVRQGAFTGGLIGRIQRFFWGKPNLQDNPRLHVPVAADVARTSADLLFAEPMTVTIPDGGANNPALADERLQMVCGGDDTVALLLEAAELCSAFGGVYLRLWWDSAISDHVMIDKVSADAAVPQWKYGKLYAVTFWTVVSVNKDRYVRHLERHEPGRIIHALYAGDEEELGEQISLADSPETAWAADLVDANGAIPTGVTTLTAAYVPNVRPNRLWRRMLGLAPLGRSDYDGLEQLFDQLDLAYSSWMQDVEQGKARIFIDRSLLTNGGPGKGASFDSEQSVFVAVNGGLKSSANDSGMPIQANQFNIRWLEHSQTCAELLNTILRAAGLSTGSFADSSLTVGVPTATEINSRDNLSERTRNKKVNYWKAALGPLTQTAMELDAMVFQTGVVLTQAPHIQFPTRTMQAPAELAQTLAALRAARVISLKQSVIKQNPNWSDQEIDDEIAAIEKEFAAQPVVDDPDEPPAEPDTDPEQENTSSGDAEDDADLQSAAAK
ncbi:phage portal protein [Nocardia sp. NBC_01327]|uniref:phage portal protein n=1 Tax=Nocardia sp. NBC_01327 TaxID=2903593 RepID=UPI002E0E4A69|nr:phage portal protein [Nocardia sp. NBC_01327]